MDQRRSHITGGLPQRLYKYLPFQGASGLLKNHEFWYRCPLDYEPGDCRADLLENLDKEHARTAYRDECIQLLCGTDPLPAPYDARGRWLHRLKESGTWNPRRVDDVFGDLFVGAFRDMDEHRERIRSEVDSVLQDLRVLSLCESCLSPSMWRDYANKGRGVCIGFRYISEIDNAIGAAQQVSYVDGWPAIATPIEWARHILFTKEIPFGQRARDALYVKLRHLSYEREWRVITKPMTGSRSDSNGVLRITLEPSEVAEIVLGWSLELAEAEAIRRIAHRHYPSANIRTLSSTMESTLTPFHAKA